MSTDDAERQVTGGNVARIRVEYAPTAEPPAGDPRFTKGTIKSAVAWVLRAVARTASGDDDALAEVARPVDLPQLRAVLAGGGLGEAARARVVDVRPAADPPHAVVEVLPSGGRAVLKAVEFPHPGWRLASLAAPDDEPALPVPERVVKFDLPPAAHGGGQLDWLIAVLVDTAGLLGADIRPATLPDTVWSSEDLGQGESRSTQSRSWEVGDIRVSAEVAEHEIYDGATPRWTYLHATATGLPPAAAVSVIASVRVAPQPAGTLFLIGPRDRIDRVAAPSL